MFGFIKSPFRSADPGNTAAASSGEKQPPVNTDDDDLPRSDMNGVKSDFQAEKQSVQELEQYAALKSEETTMAVNGCLRIAEDMREDAARTLEILNQQGEQIHRTHQMVADADYDLSKGEKILGNLGGMFSRTWKPKKTRGITGPTTTSEKPSKTATKEQKEKLGTAPASKEKRVAETSLAEPTNCYEKIEIEKVKQDEALDDLSSILGNLKGMAAEMGTELNRQDKALDHLNNDIDELNYGVKGANQRVRNLIGK